MGESDGMSGKLGGMEECHLGFIKGRHKCKKIQLLCNLSSYLCLDIDYLKLLDRQSDKLNCEDSRCIQYVTVKC